MSSATGSAERTDCDAIIVGAGPAGSSAAILLARAGWSVALVEKQRFPRRKVCGECIAASNLPLLDALGIGADVTARAGAELRAVALMRGNRTVIADLPAADDGYPWGRALGRETLDTLLLAEARAAGAAIWQPWAVRTLERTDAGWHCDLRAIDGRPGATLRAPVAIAAHGSWETLPSERDADRRTRRASDLIAFKANFRDVALAPGLLPVLSFDGGYGGMVVADGGVATVAGCIRRARLDAGRRAAIGQRAGEVFHGILEAECGGVRIALKGATRDGGWLAAGPLAPGCHLRDDDLLFRIGNAAGEAHPILGEGISMALQSAWLLCRHLLASDRRSATDGGKARALARRYRADWQHAFAPRLRLAALFAHAAMRAAPAELLLGLATRWPGRLTCGARWGGKTRCAVDPATIVALARASASPVSRRDAPSIVASRAT
jgi:flavin-dependent dehydrogenase